MSADILRYIFSLTLLTFILIKSKLFEEFVIDGRSPCIRITDLSSHLAYTPLIVRFAIDEMK